MTDSFVTQCPHCNTSFRINRAQLGAAHGAVRCGACMRVFNAVQQMLVDHNRAGTSAPPASKASSNTSAPAISAAAVPTVARKPAQPATSDKQSIDTLWIHDDLDNLDLDKELAKLEEQEIQLSREILATSSALKPVEQPRRSPKPEINQYDESWAEALLKAEAPLQQEPIRAIVEESHPSAAPAPEALTRKSQKPGKAHADIHKESSTRREPSIDDMNDETPSEPEIMGEHDNRLVPETQDKPGRAKPVLHSDILLDLNEPLQLDWQPPKKPWSRWLGWGLLNLLGAGALLLQYVNYHFDELARQDQYRPWFEKICPEIGCSLPSKVDISQIRSTNLIVRSHPQYMDALLVDAIIYNRASFAQPFPVLELHFADINGQLIVGNHFRPSEYLSGELAGQNKMPPQTPIHISLEIKDPGPRAISYSLNFQSPE